MKKYTDEVLIDFNVLAIIPDPSIRLLTHEPEYPIETKPTMFIPSNLKQFMGILVSESCYNCIDIFAIRYIEQNIQEKLEDAYLPVIDSLKMNNYSLDSAGLEYTIQGRYSEADKDSDMFIKIMNDKHHKLEAYEMSHSNGNFSILYIKYRGFLKVFSVWCDPGCRISLSHVTPKFRVSRMSSPLQQDISKEVDSIDSRFGNYPTLYNPGLLSNEDLDSQLIKKWNFVGQISVSGIRLVRRTKDSGEDVYETIVSTDLLKAYVTVGGSVKILNHLHKWDAEQGYLNALKNVVEGNPFKLEIKNISGEVSDPHFIEKIFSSDNALAYNRSTSYNSMNWIDVLCDFELISGELTEVMSAISSYVILEACKK